LERVGRRIVVLVGVGRLIEFRSIGIAQHALTKAACKPLQRPLPPEPPQQKMDPVHIEESATLKWRGADVKQAKQAAFAQLRQYVFMVVGQTVVKGQKHSGGRLAGSQCALEGITTDKTTAPH